MENRKRGDVNPRRHIEYLSGSIAEEKVVKNADRKRWK